ncbi:MAG: hypothetical protein H6742_00600 [Alphaproteobacteria bacterium]|nr:hypothetical protein [Alphaproteobacteria bacterium]
MSTVARFLLCTSGLLLPFAIGCKKEDDIVPGQTQRVDPMLQLDSPAAASWLPVGPTPVAGISRDMRTVKVGEQQLVLNDGGAFSGQVELVRGVNVVEARGTDVRGDTHYARHGVLAGTFGEPDGAIEDAAVIRLNQSGLDVLLGMIGELIDPSILDGTLSTINPIYSDSYGIFGWDAVTIEADVDGVDFGVIQLAVTPRSGALHLEGTLPDLFVDAQARGSVVGFDFDSDVTMWADRADLEATLELGAKNGMVTAELSDMSLELVGFGYDTSLLPGDVESWILVDTLQSTIEEQVLAMVEEEVPGFLDEALAGLDLSFETELLSTPLSVAADIVRVDVDGDGVELGVDITADMPNAGVEGSGFLLAGPGEAFVDHDAHMAAVIGDDLLNRMLYEAWAAGVLELSMSTYDGSLQSFLLTPLHATEGTITVDAALPPVIVEGRNGLQLQAAELIVTIDTPDGELGTHLVIAVAAKADLEVGYEDGELVLDLGEVNPVLMVRESDWGASNEAVTELVAEMLPLDTLLALVGNFSFPIPEISGLVLTDVQVSRESSGVHTGVTASLE